MHDGIEIVWGETTAAHAHLYFRATSETKNIANLTGTLYGPESLYAKTLPARFSLRTLKPGSDLLAELVVPDPCFWTPDSPLTYQLDMQWQDATDKTNDVSRLVGIRHWGIDRTVLRLLGRRTVLRGLNVGSGSLSQEQISQAHETQLTLIVHQPDEACCETASRIGAGLIADLRGVGEWPVISSHLARIRRWPSILMVIVDPAQVAAENQFATGVPILQPLKSTDGEIASWANGGLIELNESNPLPAQYTNRLPVRFTKIEKPLLVIRRNQQTLELTTVRQACDRLQSDLAPQLDLAGYFVKQ
jgi:hypothetical protein